MKKIGKSILICTLIFILTISFNVGLVPASELMEAQKNQITNDVSAMGGVYNLTLKVGQMTSIGGENFTIHYGAGRLILYPYYGYALLKGVEAGFVAITATSSTGDVTQYYVNVIN